MEKGKQLPKMDSFSVEELLLLENKIFKELKNERKIIYTRNGYVGDVAEHIVLKARGGEKRTNSNKSYDIYSADGKRIQVKARKVPRGKSESFSDFRSFDFDNAIFIIFDTETWELTEAFELSANSVESLCKERSNKTGFTITIAKVQASGEEVTEEMKKCFEALKK